MKVALVHDWLIGMRGGEKCLDTLLDILPEADIYSLIHVEGRTSKKIDKRVKGTSFLQFLPFIDKVYKLFLPFYPLAILDLSRKLKSYDLIISLSHAGVKNIRKPKGATHICYCFTPMRYIWDQGKYYLGKKFYIFYPLIIFLRFWDKKSSKNVDKFVAISKFVSARIRLFYKRKASIIYPPVDIPKIDEVKKADYFIYAGALVKYKLVDQIVYAFNEIGEKLLILGDGPEKEKLEKIAKGNISFKSTKNDKEFLSYIKAARGFIFSGTEDFGILPIEAQALGIPVICKKKGGLSETIIEGYNDKKSGVFFKDSSKLKENIIDGLKNFIDNEDKFDKTSCMENAKSFSREKFILAWKDILREYDA